MTSILTIACIITLLIPFAVLNIIFYPISKKLSAKFSTIIVKYCSSNLFSLLNVYKKFKCIKYRDNTENLPEQFLIICNHQSILDIPLLFEFFSHKILRFVAKEELGRHVPVVSEMLRSHEHALMPRSGSPAVMMRVLDRFAQRVIEKGWIPVVFPEGTRSRDGKVGKFYAAGFRRILDKAPMPVLVVALDGGYKFSTLGAFLSKMEDGAFRIKVLKVYDKPLSKAEQVFILEEGKMLIEQQLSQWRY